MLRLGRFIAHNTSTCLRKCISNKLGLPARNQLIFASQYRLMSSNKAEGGALAQKALDILTKKNGFERIFSGIKLVENIDGHCVCELKLEEQHLNLNQSVHGGAIASLIDIVTSVAIACHPFNAAFNGGVSTDLNISYLRAAKLGDVIVIDTLTTKFGKNLCFTTADVKDKTSGKLIAQGRHTKFLVNKL